MVSLHQITPSLAADYKAVRLRALLDTPSAFGSTYVRESQFSDDDWQQRAANLYTPRSIGYLAHYLDDYCGIAAAFLEEQTPQYAELIGMWVAPEHRRTGTGRLLVDAIESWARASGARTFQLMVTSTWPARRRASCSCTTGAWAQRPSSPKACPRRWPRRR